MARQAPLAQAVLSQRKSLSSLCFTRLPVGAPHADHGKLKGLEPFISVSVVNPLMLKTAGPLMTVFRVQPAIHSIK